MHTVHTVDLRNREPLILGSTPLVMGILNVTPDSFSDGGLHDNLDLAVAHARAMVEQGAHILDVGGESTRPGSETVAVQEELDRVIPVIDAIRNAGITTPISIDTNKPLVADQAIQAGADIINDVFGLQGPDEMVEIAALYGVPVIAMHWDKLWDAQTEPMSSMVDYFIRTLAIAEARGLAASQVILDPGFGFTKTLAQNYQILRELPQLSKAFSEHGILIGTSRKSMIGRLLDNLPNQRLAGTIATTVQGYERGGHIFRVHDVGANRDALRVAQATLYGP